MTKPAAIIFDWDGTLVDSFGFLLAAHNHARANMKMPPVTDSDFRAVFGKSRETVYQTLYGARGEEARGHFTSYVQQNHKKDVRPLPGAAQLLETMRAHNIQSAIVSNKQGSFVRAEIEALGWTAHFGTVIAAGETQADKPAPDPLDMAIENLKLNKNSDKIWYVGDSETDALCAKNASIPFIALRGDPSFDIWISKYTPIKIFEDCRALREFLLQAASN